MLLNVILDIILVAVFLLGILLGIKKGFVKVVTKPLRSLLAIAIAFATASPGGCGLISPVRGDPLVNKISSFLYDNYSHVTSANTDELPTFIKLMASMAGVDVSTLGDSSDEIIEAIVETLTMPIVNVVSTIIAFVIILVLLLILLPLLFSLIDSLFSKGLLGIFNKVLGSVICGLFAIFVAWVIVLIFEYIVHLLSASDSTIFSNFTGGLIYSFFKQYNPVELLLSF